MKRTTRGKAAGLLTAGVVAVLGIVGCKREPKAEAVPVSEYIKADSVPTYATKGDAWEPPTVRFTDVTAEAGIEFKHITGASGNKWMPETLGGGGVFFDYDGDDRPDVLLINSTYWPGEEQDRTAPTGRLYRNRGDGTFEDLTEASGWSGLSCYGMGAAAADYDGDGDEDIYITAVGRNHLLRNDEGRLVDVTESAGVGFSECNEGAAPWEWSTAALWFDPDRDGDLDLLVGNYVRWDPENDIWTTLDGTTKAYTTPERYEGESCVLFRNEGDGTFRDVTKAVGLFNPEGKTISAVADDFNDDGWPDLVVTNDRQPNFLYLNAGDGTFVDEALMAGVAYDDNGLARAGMGVSVADVGNSGPRSIAIGNFSGEAVSLYTQAGGGMFIDRAGPARLARPTGISLTFGLLFADLNLDGYEDLVLANGHIEPEIESVRRDWRFEQRPQLLINNGRGQFVEVTDQAGEPFQETIVGRSLSTADYDDDGDLDLLLVGNGGPARLLRNELISAPDSRRAVNVVRIRLLGHSSNPKAIGARLKATVNDQVQTRFIHTGGSYLAQSELVATFGLGEATRVDRLEVRWPDGTEDVFTALPAGQVYSLGPGGQVVSERILGR